MVETRQQEPGLVDFGISAIGAIDRYLARRQGIPMPAPATVTVAGGGTRKPSIFEGNTGLIIVAAVAVALFIAFRK